MGEAPASFGTSGFVAEARGSGIDASGVVGMGAPYGITMPPP